MKHQRQPTEFSCGQTVLAMIVGRPVADVFRVIPDEGPTSIHQLADYLAKRGFACDRKLRIGVVEGDLAIVRLVPKKPKFETRRSARARTRRGHWVLLAGALFYDPAEKKPTASIVSRGMKYASYLAVSKTSDFVAWPDDEPPRYNGSGTPCDMWRGPCSCGAWHLNGPA